MKIHSSRAEAQHGCTTNQWDSPDNTSKLSRSGIQPRSLFKPSGGSQNQSRMRAWNASGFQNQFPAKSTRPLAFSALVFILFLLASAFPIHVCAQGALQNGARAVGEISTAGASDAWTFSANAGDGIMIRVGSTNFTPHIQLYGPENTILQETTSGNSSYRDGFITYQATSTGSYKVLVSATFASQTGTYSVTLAQAPEAFVVSPGDEGGILTNGVANVGTIDRGDLDVWSFAANGGDSFMIRAGATSFTPWIRVYDPNGVLVEETTSGNSSYRDGFVTGQATNNGNYTVVLSATFQSQEGGYSLSFAIAPGSFTVSPGDDGGVLTNGLANVGTIDRGDLDMWSFTANAGDSFMIRAGATNFTPWIRVYDPSGVLAEKTTSGNSSYRDGFVTGQATNNGNYTVVLSATFQSQEGGYGLSFAIAPGAVIVSPGDEGGVLTNGVANVGTIDRGDLDVWSFAANAGDSFMIRAGATNFTPWIRVYDPNGVLAEETTSGNSSYRDGYVTGQATNNGNYTVVLSATFANQDGGYGLSFAQAPEVPVISEGDQGGPLLNGFTHDGTLARGDIDVWTFYGTPGDSNVLHVTGTGFTPWLRVLDPSGNLAAETKSGNSAVRSGSVSLVVTNGGNYTVTLSATYQNQSGTYTFKESRVPPDLNVPDSTVMEESAAFNVSINAQDPDVPDKPLVFGLLSGPPGMTLALAGSTNATLSWPTTEADGPSTNLVVVTVTDTVNGQAFIRTNSFSMVVQEINTAPRLTVPADQDLDELTPLNVTASATDSDLPANPLIFSLLEAPESMAIDPATGAISWTPSEAQGPSTNRITVVVTDSSPFAANAQSLSATNSFNVVVREVNLAPKLTVPVNQVIDELTPLTLAASASDADLPANHLTYSLVSAPEELAINPTTGVITWTPTEAQGPSTNSVSVKVQDDGMPSLSAMASFTIVVNEQNSAPVLPTQSPRAITELATVIVTNTATDSDIPLNTIAYTLTGPTNAVISADGVITWTPTEAQGPSTNVFTTVVTDNGTPTRSATNIFVVTVSEVNTAPVLAAISDQSLHFGTLLSLQAAATDADRPANKLTYSLDQAPNGASIDPVSGLVSWTPAENQVGTHTLTVHVTDDGSPPLSDSKSFQVTVSGSGTRLDIERIAVLTQITISADVGNNYELQTSSDLTNWTKLIQFNPLASSPFSYIDPDSQTNSARFYRLKLLDQ